MKHFIPLLISLLIFLFFPVSALAVEIRPYLITAGQEFVGTPNLPTILWHKTIVVPWKSGKVLISANPDGTGSMDVGVQFEVYASDSSKSFKYYAGCTEKPMPPLDITYLMGPRYPHLGGDSNIMIRYNKVFCNNAIKVDGVYKQYVNVGPAYLVHFDDAPEQIQPFLDLPWDYVGDENTFSTAATNMSSYFDHTYPLLSTTLSEPNGTEGYVTSYLSFPNKDLSYTSHDGYDWARNAGAILGDPVLAAAAGTATFKKYGACGNMIMIDHGNDFQTRYCHLDSLDLVTTGMPIAVTQGQMIGRVGMTGRTTGAHIHFMVIQDKDRNGNFDDNIPDGLVDPFGWDSIEVDPWETYAFEYNGEQKTGNTSRYLWTTPLPSIKQPLSSSGKNVTVAGAKVSIPTGFVSQDTVLSIKSIPPSPVPSLAEVADGVWSTIGTAIEITIDDGFGNLLTQFSKSFNISMKYDQAEIGRIDPATISLYSSTDGVSWAKELSTVDTTTQVVVANVNHLTQFAIMGKKLDGEAPVTTASLTGPNEGTNQYYSPVAVALDATDGPTEATLGIEQTLVRIDGGEMEIYEVPSTITTIGPHTIEYYSIDQDGNEEQMKSLTFEIVPEPTPTPTPTATPTSSPTATPTQAPAITPIEKEHKVKNEKKEKKIKKTKKSVLKMLEKLREELKEKLESIHIKHVEKKNSR